MKALLVLLGATTASADPLPWCGTFAPERRALVSLEPVLAPELVIDVKLDPSDAHARLVMERGLAHCFAGDVFIIVGLRGIPLDVHGDNKCLVDGAWKLRFAAGAVRALHAHVKR